MRLMAMWLVTSVMVVFSAAQQAKPITDWLVCGPFPFGRGLTQFFTDHLTEHGGEANIQPTEGMEHTVKELGKVVWKHHRAPNGVLDFVELMAKHIGEERPRYWLLRYGLVYAYTEIFSDKPQRALLLLGSEDWLAVWLNGKLIHENFVYRHCVPDKDAVLVKLNKGTNRLLVKVARVAGGWGVSAKILMPITQKLFVKTEPYNSCQPDGNAFIPEIREGETTPIWGYVTVVNTSERTLPFVTARVRENDWFAGTSEQIGELVPGESSQLPFLIAPKRPLRPDESPHLDLVVSTLGEQHDFRLPVTVRRKNEPFFSSHRSRIDGSVQPMTLLVPPDYNPQRTYPLVVALHGSKGCLIGHAFSVKLDFIIVAPHGRGQTGYRDFGEVDVFEAMDEVKLRYRIDEGRIYLTGHSMGGGGTFRLATRYPHIWAAVAPMAAAGARPFEWLRNLLHVPTLFYHGSEDEVVPVKMAREAASYIQRLGYNFRYEEVQGKPHWWGVDFPEMFAFFAQYRRATCPDRIAFWTNDHRANRAYWLEIVDFVDYTKPASVEAQVAGKTEGETMLELKTENVGEVELKVNEAPTALRKLPLVVNWNGFTAKVERLSTLDTIRIRLREPLVGVLVNEGGTAHFWQWQRDGAVVFAESDGTSPQAKFLKTPKRCGPVSDVFTAPFVAVYDAQSEGAKDAVKRFQHWWQNYALGVCKVVQFHNDKELQTLMANLGKTANLVVFQKAPVGTRFGRIVFERDGISVGSQRFKGESVAARVLVPNPFNPQNYLLLNIGMSDEALRVLAYVPMELGQPYDYMVVDKRFLEEGIKGILAVGQWARVWCER